MISDITKKVYLLPKTKLTQLLIDRFKNIKQVWFSQLQIALPNAYTLTNFRFYRTVSFREKASDFGVVVFLQIFSVLGISSVIIFIGKLILKEGNKGTKYYMSNRK